MGYIKHTYDSLGAFVAAAKREPLNSTKSSRKTESAEWYGTPDFDTAVDLALNGWADGCKSLMAAMAYAQSLPAFTPSFTMDVAGAYPVPALAAAGDPCSMVYLAPSEERVRPIVRLLVSRNGSAAYEASEFLSYGAAVLSYIEGLEAAGFRCEITIAFTGVYSTGNCDQHCITVLAKKAEDPLELDRMAFVLTHASFFRRICFAVKESEDGIWQQLGSDYGSVRNPDPKLDAEAGQIIIPGVNMAKPESPHLRTPEAAMKFFGPMIEAQLREAGLAPPPLAFGGTEGTRQ